MERYFRKITVHKKNQRSERLYAEPWKKHSGFDPWLPSSPPISQNTVTNDSRSSRPTWSVLNWHFSPNFLRAQDIADVEKVYSSEGRRLGGEDQVNGNGRWEDITSMVEHK
jgi:hypothetical protein